MEPITDTGALVELFRGNLESGLRRILESQLIGVAFIEFNGVIITANDGFLQTIGYTLADLAQEQLSLHQITPPEHHRLDEDAFDKLKAFGKCAVYEKEFLRKDGSRVPVFFGGVSLNDAAVCFLIDLSHDRQAQERLNHLVNHDALTDLPNQVLFRDRLKQAIALSRRNDQLQGVLLLNLDRFKTINDSLGYTAGDRILQSVAQRLTSCVRSSDTVARFGSDEFAILLTQIGRPQDAANTARAIKEVLAQAFLCNEQELFISSSIGISVYPQDGQDSPELLKNAGSALDRAKKKGGNSFEFYTSGGTTHALKQLLLESNMRPGLERREFTVEYQPQVDVKNYRLVGMEALTRWEHPQLGLLYPGEFMSLAEDNGLIIPIGDWVMQTACAQNKSWQDAGFEPLRLSVNFSARQFQQPGFIATVAEILKESNLDPRWLELELTESAIVKEPERAIEKMQELRRMGLRIAIDDFGTGYSSLNYLKRFPVDTLKIDKSFIDDVCSDPHDAAIVRAIVTLGHALDLTVIAEGVETHEQLDFLTSVGCDVIQGFLFSKSLTTDAFRELLMEQLRVSTPTTSNSTTRLPSITRRLQPL